MAYIVEGNKYWRVIVPDGEQSKRLNLWYVAQNEVYDWAVGRLLALDEEESTEDLSKLLSKELTQERAKREGWADCPTNLLRSQLRPAFRYLLSPSTANREWFRHMGMGFLRKKKENKPRIEKNGLLLPKMANILRFKEKAPELGAQLKSVRIIPQKDEMGFYWTSLIVERPKKRDSRTTQEKLGVKPLFLPVQT